MFWHLWQRLLQEDDFYRIRLPSNVLNPPGRDYIISSVKAVSMNGVCVSLKFLNDFPEWIAFSLGVLFFTANFSFYGFITDLFFEFKLILSLWPLLLLYCNHCVMILGSDVAWSFSCHYHMILVYSFDPLWNLSWSFLVHILVIDSSHPAIFTLLVFTWLK